MVAGQDITCAAIAGVESHGMCCSERELGISDDHAGLMELPQDTPVGTDICDLYAIKDTVFRGGQQVFDQPPGPVGPLRHRPGVRRPVRPGAEAPGDCGTFPV